MNQSAELFIDCRCELGEGPFWNHLTQQFFWFDIVNQTLFCAGMDGQIADRFIFDAPVSAAAIIDRNSLAVAGAGFILRLDLASDTRTPLVPLEADKPGNRSNDGRINPAGGFWIGTMSRRGDNDPEAGAVYQFRNGKLDRVLDRITIPNSICFSPGGDTAYFTDTPTNRILKCRLDKGTGMPAGDWELFADVSGHRGSPDGSIVDSEGYLWNARWGGSCVVRHAPDGSIDRIVELPVSQVTCPALGGPELRTLFVTSAREHLTPQDLEAQPLAGSIFAVEVDVPGFPDPLLKL